MNVSIRPEQPEDAASVREINQLAFEGPLEAKIVDAVRGSDGAISLVAVVDGKVVGHILFTPVTITPPLAGSVIAGLAPMAVRPEFQRQGIGGRLIHAGLDECRARAYKAVVVVGHAEYYPRFGFVPALTKGIQYEAPLPPEVFMVIELEANALAGHRGVIRFLPEFSVSE